LAGWRLVREAAASALATLELPPADRPEALAIRLRALGPLPATLESAPVDVPDGATLELGFRVANEPSDRAAAAHFTPAPRCGDAPARRLVTERVAGGGASAPRWHDAAVTVGAASRGCRLRLDAAQPAASGVRAVWAVPRLVAPPSAPPPPSVVVI